MANNQTHPLRHYELRLLRCSLPSPPPPPPPSDNFLHHRDLHDLISLIEAGRYLESLSSTPARTIFRFADSLDLLDSAQFYSALENAVDFYLNSDGDGDSDNDVFFRVLVVVSIAVAAFFAFVQSNLTGPVIELPSVPLPWKEVKEVKEWEGWARIQLMTAAGSDLLAKLSNLQYMVFAKILLFKARDLLFRENAVCADGPWTTSWWLARLILLQQLIMDERCSSLLDLLQVFFADSLNHFGDIEKAVSYWGSEMEEEEALNIVSVIHLEAGLSEHSFGRVDPARRYFESAAQVLGLELSVTGILGFRTVHQVEPKAQMVLVANRNSSTVDGSSVLASNPHENGTSTEEATLNQNHGEVKEASDILRTPRIIGNGGNETDAMKVIQNSCGTNLSLSAVQQSVVLSQCLLVEKSGRLDELQRWDMAPYIEAIDSQESSYFSIKRSCNILRIGWEATRSRTKERALLMMDEVVRDLYEPSPPVQERVRSCFGVYVPAVPVLKKEYGELLVSSGLVGEALKIFEDLELWDNLIYCYRLLEKKAAAVELIKARLLETPNDPRLWCSLGDVTNDDTCFEKALAVSNDRSARAKRSLARSAYNKGDYERSKSLWESAMSLNSLYPDGWFALGAAALKARDINKALDGFTRAVQLDPDNGEAWNNIACLHMIRCKSEEAFVAFKEALKFKRNSWQMWENYGQVAADVGNFDQALEATRMVLNLSSNKRFDGELLERITQEMEKRAALRHSYASMGDRDCTNQTVSGSELAECRETDRLMELLGKILQQIVRSDGGGDAWGLYARWHKMKGDLTMCSEALLKQVRSYQGSEVWKDIARFRKFAHASLELCKIYMEISSSSGSVRELRQADMHLHNIIKQASAFSETEEFKALQVCHDEVGSILKSKQSSPS